MNDMIWILYGVGILTVLVIAGLVCIDHAEPVEPQDDTDEHATHPGEDEPTHFGRRFERRD